MSYLIIYLGAPNSTDGSLSQIALSRLRMVEKIFQNFHGCDIVLTGGKGDHFNTGALNHWQYAKEKLVDMGISEASILAGVNSRNTREDILLLEKSGYLKNYKFIFFVTSSFHVPRVSILLSKIIKKHYCIFPAENEGIDIDLMLQAEINKIKGIINE